VTGVLLMAQIGGRPLETAVLAAIHLIGGIAVVFVYYVLM